MPSPTWEDLDEFLEIEEFATEAVITRQDGAIMSVTGIYDDPYYNAELGEYDMDNSNPRLTCKESDVVGVTRGDTIEVNGSSWDILTAPQSDGTGVAVIFFAEQQDY